jgi:ATP-binding cassette subfamily B (MDR/TAP) protein 1
MGPQSDVDLEEMRAILFQNVIGSLVYAMVCTRPNIAKLVGVVSHFMVNLGQSH